MKMMMRVDVVYDEMVVPEHQKMKMTMMELLREKLGVHVSVRVLKKDDYDTIQDEDDQVLENNLTNDNVVVGIEEVGVVDHVMMGNMQQDEDEGLDHHHPHQLRMVVSNLLHWVDLDLDFEKCILLVSVCVNVVGLVVGKHDLFP